MKKLYIKPKSTAVAVNISEIIAGSIVDIVDNDNDYAIDETEGGYTPEGGGNGDNDARRDLWDNMW